jgi:putative addiction module component (TIGR02574 family)
VAIDIQELRGLTPAEKLQIVTTLWDDIADAAADLVVPEHVVAEACRRADELDADPNVAISSEQLWRRVNGS